MHHLLEVIIKTCLDYQEIELYFEIFDINRMGCNELKILTANLIDEIHFYSRKYMEFLYNKEFDVTPYLHKIQYSSGDQFGFINVILEIGVGVEYKIGHDQSLLLERINSILNFRQFFGDEQNLEGCIKKLKEHKIVYDSIVEGIISDDIDRVKSVIATFYII